MITRLRDSENDSCGLPIRRTTTPKSLLRCCTMRISSAFICAAVIGLSTVNRRLEGEAPKARRLAVEWVVLVIRPRALRKQLAQVERDQTAKEELLARRMGERDRVDAERTATQEAFTTVETRLSQVRSDRGYRSERLKIIDPGIVPEQPSAPNIPLHVLAALLLGLVVPAIYLTLELSYRTQRSDASREAAPVAPQVTTPPTRTLRASASSKWTADD